MRNRLFSLTGLALVAGALVLLSPGESQAQRRGGGWGGGRGGGWSGGIGYSNYGGLSAGIGYGRGYGYGYPGYYGGYGGLGYGYGGLGYGYGRGYGGYSSYGYGYPGYYGSSYYSYSPSSVTPYYGDSYAAPSYAYSPQTSAYQSFYPSDTQQQTSNAAFINVMVPADAEVWFDGSPTQQRGPVREFQTPPLDPSRTFTYQIKARWMQNGQAVEDTRTAQVQANQTATVDFNSGRQQQPPPRPPQDLQRTPVKQQQPPPPQ